MVGWLAVLLALLCCGALPAAGQDVTSTAAQRLRPLPVTTEAIPAQIPPSGAGFRILGPRIPGGSAPPPAAASAPELRLWREVALVGTGAGLLLAGELASVDRIAVPPTGLDPSGIRWGLDRRSLGSAETGRLSASDWTLKGALVLPVAAKLAFGPYGARRWDYLARSGVVYGEALALSSGLTWLGKSVLSRPRPYTYSAGPMAAGDAYDPAQERAFRSMPSGHAALAWTGAGASLTMYLLDRAEAPGWERVGAGMVAGGLATMTALFRVQAGQHFPSDVLVGSGIGVASGIAIPLLHRGDRSLPSRRALLETLGGTVLGSVLVVALF